eukprot:XP_011419606.1 PREDICTED: kunitz-type U1-aranetoxin-Av1a-like [Crassostrea gigas]
MSLMVFSFVLVAVTSVEAYWFPRITPTPSMTLTPSFATPAPLLNAPCGFSPEPGPCKAFKPMYYFDVISSTCKTFNYGGCSGNANKYETENLCKYVCTKHSCLKIGCIKKACTTQICPNHPGAICFPVCECFSVWILNGKEVSDTCNSNSG